MEYKGYKIELMHWGYLVTKDSELQARVFKTSIKAVKKEIDSLIKVKEYAQLIKGQTIELSIKKNQGK